MDDQIPRADPPDGQDRHWAPTTSRLKVTDIPSGAVNLNLDGRRTSGALQGFGQLWQKTFRVRLSGVTLSPAEVMQVWREKFPEYQPAENRFYPTMAGIQPGELIFISGKVPAVPGTPSIMPISSGVMVLYVDDQSFTVMTPEGFPESGWNTFSVAEEDGAPVAQVQTFTRASDPLYEFFFRFMGSSAQQDKTWTHVLTSLAEYFSVSGQVIVSKTLVDPKLQWNAAKNIWKNAAARTVFYMLGAPLRWLGIGK